VASGDDTVSPSPWTRQGPALSHSWFGGNTSKYLLCHSSVFLETLWDTFQEQKPSSKLEEDISLGQRVLACYGKLRPKDAAAYDSESSRRGEPKQTQGEWYSPD
jgi:hypothetical protein